MAWDVRMSMSAHVTTKRRQDRHQDEQQKNYLKISQNSSPGNVSMRDEDRQQRCRQPTRELETKGKMLDFFGHDPNNGKIIPDKVSKSKLTESNEPVHLQISA